MAQEARTAHLHPSIGVGAALAGGAIGLLLVLLPLSVEWITVLSGAGTVLTGFKMLGSPPKNLLTVLLAVSLTLGGALLALWPDPGAPFLGYLIGGLILVQVAHSLRFLMPGQRQRWGSALVTAIAGVLFGTLALVWPVLTLTVFRYVMGAWLVFVCISSVIEVLHARGFRIAGAGTGALGASLALTVAVSFTTGAGILLGDTNHPKPGSFYVAPPEIPADAGQLIRWEPLTTGVPSGTQAWRVLYTTTLPGGEPAVSSGTVMAPEGSSSGSSPVLSVAHGTTGIDAACAPSMSVTPFASGAASALESMVVEHDWVAVTSDYVGLGTQGTHPYLVGEAEAQNVLDATLAARQLPGLNLSTQTVLWGHSQGGQAALWAGQIAEYYAPELTVKGVAAFAPATDVYGLVTDNLGDPAATTVASYLAAAWSSVFPELQVRASLLPDVRQAVDSIAQRCFQGEDAAAALLLGSQLPELFEEAALEGDLGEKLKAQSPTGPFTASVLVAQGMEDTLITPQSQRAWVKRVTQAGVDIDYSEWEDLNHNTLVAESSPFIPKLVKWTLFQWQEQ